MRILDIGGGFAGGSFDASGTVQLGLVPGAVNTALDTHFTDLSVKVCPAMGWHERLCHHTKQAGEVHWFR